MTSLNKILPRYPKTVRRPRALLRDIVARKSINNMVIGHLVYDFQEEGFSILFQPHNGPKGSFVCVDIDRGCYVGEFKDCFDYGMENIK